MSRKAIGVAASLFWLRCFLLFAADFLECGENFRRNALRQKFPTQEVLGIAFWQNIGAGQISYPVASAYLPKAKKWNMTNHWVLLAPNGSSTIVYIG